MAEILNKFPLVYVNSINSIGNGLYIDSDKEEVVIKPKEASVDWAANMSNQQR